MISMYQVVDDIFPLNHNVMHWFINKEDAPKIMTKHIRIVYKRAFWLRSENNYHLMSNN